MFFVQAFFELFETMLSYFSNTLSFVRIGAFAVSHAAMMEVVLMLGGATQKQQSKLDRHCSRQHICLPDGRACCRNPGVKTGIL